MRILIINTFYYPNSIGGAEESTKILAEGLRMRGHEVYVLTCDSDKDYIVNEEINNIKIIRTKPIKSKSYLKNNNINKLIKKIFEERNYFYIKSYKQIINNIKPDVVHTNNLFGFSPIVWKINNQLKIKTIHTARDYWGICPKTTLIKNNGQVCDSKNILCKLHEKNMKYLSKYVDYFTSPSKFTLECYKNRGFFNKSKFAVVENSVQIDLDEHFRIKKIKEDRKENKIEFLYIGTLTKHKGIVDLIKVFKSIKNDNIKLNICGNGILKDDIIKMIENDNRIEYLGKVYGEKKDDIFIKSDVMIVPSLWYEPFGRVVIEAYKYAMPVIGSNIGGLSEVLEDDVSIKIDNNSEKQLIQSIEYVFNNNNRISMIKNTTNYLDKYKIEKQLDTFEEIYKQLLS